MSEACFVTLPHPDEWEKGRDASADYDPECVCPCLHCHPIESSYENAAYVARELYGEPIAATMIMLRMQIVEDAKAE